VLRGDQELKRFAPCGLRVFQVNQQRNRRRRDARNTRSLAKGLRTGFAELALDLLGQAGNRGVVDIHRQAGVFTGAQPGDLVLLRSM
jgi:hypothetical protein